MIRLRKMILEEGSKTLLQDYLYAAELRARGLDAKQVHFAVTKKLGTAGYPNPARTGIAYMIAPVMRGCINDLIWARGTSSLLVKQLGGRSDDPKSGIRTLYESGFHKLLSVVRISTNRLLAAYGTAGTARYHLYLISVAASISKYTALWRYRIRMFGCANRFLPLSADEIVPRSPTKR